MIASTLPVAWALVVVAVAARHRPAPPRVRALIESARRGRRPAGPRHGLVLTRLVERLGAGVLGRAGRPADPPTARRLGAAAVVGLAALPVLPLAAVPAASTAWAVPAVAARRREQRRQARLAAGLPEVVDLLALAVGSGLTVHLALAQVARRAEGPLAAELARVVDEVALGRRLADALDDVPTRGGEALRPLVAALVASERYGAPLGPGLDRLADEVRRDRRRRAEEAARKVPVKLLFPLVTCTLPAFGLLTVAPLIASAVRSLRI
ncbi:MAG TPA: type II secretion system F family protein [Acidimicrobiales bacterium]|nr:type II secretion system F family protein [Acidimicrobiales bacterium]